MFVCVSNIVFGCCARIRIALMSKATIQECVLFDVCHLLSIALFCTCFMFRHEPCYFKKYYWKEMEAEFTSVAMSVRCIFLHVVYVYRVVLEDLVATYMVGCNGAGIDPDPSLFDVFNVSTTDEYEHRKKSLLDEIVLLAICSRRRTKKELSRLCQ